MPRDTEFSLPCFSIMQSPTGLRWAHFHNSDPALISKNIPEKLIGQEEKTQEFYFRKESYMILLLKVDHMTLLFCQGS